MSRRTPLRSQLFLEGLEDRRVPSVLGGMQHLVDMPGSDLKLPVGWVKHELHLQKLYKQLEKAEKKDHDGEKASPQTSAQLQLQVHIQQTQLPISTISEASVTPSLNLISRIQEVQTRVSDLDEDEVEVRIERQQNSNKSAVEKPATSDTPAVRAGVAVMGPLQTVDARAERDRTGTGKGVMGPMPADFAAKEQGPEQGRLDFVPMLNGQATWQLSGVPEVGAVPNASPSGATPVEDSARQIGPSGWLGRLANAETEEAARANRALSLGNTEMQWTPSSAAERGDQADQELDDAPPALQAHLFGAPMAASEPTLGLAIQQFLDQLDEIGQELSRSLSRNPWVAWLVAGTLGVAAAELTRRRLHRRTRVALVTAADESLSWVPGLPGPFSTEES